MRATNFRIDFLIDFFNRPLIFSIASPNITVRGCSKPDRPEILTKVIWMSDIDILTPPLQIERVNRWRVSKHKLNYVARRGALTDAALNIHQHLVLVMLNNLKPCALFP